MYTSYYEKAYEAIAEVLTHEHLSESDTLLLKAAHSRLLDLEFSPEEEE